jgi:hypothetical protein
MHAVAVRALEVLMKREEPLAIAVQNVAEFWKRLPARSSITASDSR